MIARQAISLLHTLLPCLRKQCVQFFCLTDSASMRRVALKLLLSGLRSLGEATTHWLRHSCFSHLTQATGDLVMVRSLAGHARLSPQP